MAKDFIESNDKDEIEIVDELDEQDDASLIDEYQEELDELYEDETLDEDDAEDFEEDEIDDDFDESETEDELFSEVLNLIDEFEESERKFTTNDTQILNNYIKKNGFDEYVEEIFDYVLDSGDCESIYNFADVTDVDMDAISEAIENTGDGEWIFKLAKDKTDANVTMLSEAEANSGNFNFIVRFANEIENADLEALSMGIAQLNDASQIYEFASAVKGANQRLQSVAIAKLANPDFIILAMKNFSGLDKKTKEALTRGMKNSQSAQSTLEFLKVYPEANVDILSKGVLKSPKFIEGEKEEVEAVCQFVKEYAPSNIDEFKAVFDKLDNAEYSAQFESSIKSNEIAHNEQTEDRSVENESELDGAVR